MGSDFRSCPAIGRNGPSRGGSEVGYQKCRSNDCPSFTRGAPSACPLPRGKGEAYAAPPRAGRQEPRGFWINRGYNWFGGIWHRRELSVRESNRARSVAIAVMAKAPVAGRIKTRLVPPLDPAEAAALGAAFLRDMIENIALAARDVPLECHVAYAPAGAERLFDGVLAGGTPLLLADGNAPMPPRVLGMGRSLLHAVQSLVAAGYGGVCLVNSDSPTLPTSLLCTAAAALLVRRERVVLGPAEDGGYYLIGVQAPHAHLFEDIDWSTDRVAAQTRTRARALGLELLELPAWYDVDDPDGLKRLLDALQAPAVEGPTPYEAPATTACLQSLYLSSAPARRAGVADSDA